jgi:hypothetical protein
MGTQMFVELVLPLIFVGALVVFLSFVALRVAAEKLRVLRAERLELEARRRQANVVTNQREEALAAITEAVNDLLLEVTNKRNAATYSLVPTELMQRVLDADAELSRSLRKGIE